MGLHHCLIIDLASLVYFEKGDCEGSISKEAELIRMFIFILISKLSMCPVDSNS